MTAEHVANGTPREFPAPAPVEFLSTSVGEIAVRRTPVLCYADPSRLHPQRRAVAEEEARRRDELPYVRQAFVGSTQSLLATYLDRGPEHPWALAGRVEAPTLLVYGRQDKLVDPKAAHRATKEFREAHVMVIPDSEHLAQMEHPELADQRWQSSWVSASGADLRVPSVLEEWVVGSDGRW